MSLEHNYQVSSNLSELTHDFLSSHSIAPTPVNYSVIYLYISNENELLNAAIDRFLSQKATITTDFIADLFERYVSFSNQVENNVLSPFEKTLTKTLDQINQQVGNEEKVTKSLNKLKTILTKTEHHQSIKHVVGFLFETISNTKAQHQVLSKELSTTQQEIDQLKSKLASSRKEALIDSLTGLLNRRGCDDKLQTLNFSHTHSSLAIDIDHFKRINDTFGHFVGDQVIQRIAKTIASQISEHDFAVRFGGEEFVVIIANKTMSEAKIIAEKIRLSIEKMKLIRKETNAYLPPISVSIGIAENNNVSDWHSLFKQADDALYQAKNSGRNRCICA